MKIIKNLTIKHRIYMYQAVNSSNDKGLTLAMRRARKSLFEKLGDGTEAFENGTVNFRNVEGKDLILKQAEINTLKECMEAAVWPTMTISLEVEKVEDLIANAEDYKETPANLTPETAKDVDEVIKG